MYGGLFIYLLDTISGLRGAIEIRCTLVMIHNVDIGY